MNLSEAGKAPAIESVESPLDALAGCPCCGSESVVWSDAFNRVRCNNCYIGTQRVPHDVANLRGREVVKAEAFAAWNARAFPSEADRTLLSDIRDLLVALGQRPMPKGVVARFVDPLTELIARIEGNSWREKDV